MSTVTEEKSTATAEEIAEFRAEVNRYLETGKSDVLTVSEKVELDKTRNKYRGFWARLFS